MLSMTSCFGKPDAVTLGLEKILGFWRTALGDWHQRSLNTTNGEYSYAEGAYSWVKW